VVSNCPVAFFIQHPKIAYLTPATPNTSNMKPISFLLLFCLMAVGSLAQGGKFTLGDKDEQEIRALMARQSQAWNQGNIDAFMKGYWESDSLLFIGKSGVTHGYQNTLNNYKKGYSDTAKMGKLFFDIIEVRKLSPDYRWVLGKWFLKRSVGDVGGHYTLLFRKIKGRWVIVADHSS
jgi:uncharacterized protein (TIGR02246 family)